MPRFRTAIALAASIATLSLCDLSILPMSALAQAEQPTAASTAPQPLSSADLETLVARIALYPDDLVALIMSAAPP